MFHLAAVVSGEAEQNFDLGMRVNFQGSLRLLDAIRARGACPRLVFASSVAAYGGDMPGIVEDSTILTPQTSYGSQKAAVELLLNDYSRRGFVDGRALRLPTVVVRPGKANAAASSFASAVIREPLEGRAYACPVTGECEVWLLSPRRAVESFLHAANLPAEAFGTSRAVALPGMTVTVREMVDTPARERRATGSRPASPSRPTPSSRRLSTGGRPASGRSVRSRWASHPDADFPSVVEAFIEDDLGARIVA